MKTAHPHIEVKDFKVFRHEQVIHSINSFGAKTTCAVNSICSIPYDSSKSLLSETAAKYCSLH